jgi:hypothetical protein
VSPAKGYNSVTAFYFHHRHRSSVVYTAESATPPTASCQALPNWEFNLQAFRTHQSSGFSAHQTGMLKRPLLPQHVGPVRLSRSITAVREAFLLLNAFVDMLKYGGGVNRDAAASAIVEDQCSNHGQLIATSLHFW